MKLFLCLVTVLGIGAAAFADDNDFDEFAVPEIGMCANGNILFSHVGNYSVTPCKWIQLSTNSNYRVVCQIAYECLAFNNGASTAREIMQTRQIENGLNLALLKFLQKNYAALSDGELVRKYRAGSVRAKVDEDFPDWFERVKGTLKALHKKTLLDDVSVMRVSMRAVGPFAEAIDAL